MPFYNKYPATNLNQPNMKWIIKQVKDDKVLAEGAAADAAEAKTIASDVAQTANDALEKAQEALDSSGVTDVQINNTSIVDGDGVASIPTAGQKFGVLKIGATNNGVQLNANGELLVNVAANVDINMRRYRSPITPNNMDYALRRAMCDGVGEQWTPNERDNARQRLGFSAYELIETITVSADNTSISRTSEPDGTPYNFRKIKIAWTAPATGTQYNQNVYINGAPFVYERTIGKIIIAATGTPSGLLEADVTDGLINARFEYNNANLNAPDYWRCPGYNVSQTRVNAITAITINEACKQGLQLKIYAVRR